MTDPYAALRATPDRLPVVAWSDSGTNPLVSLYHAQAAIAALQEQVSALEADAQRLEWLMHRLPGAVLRELGVITSAGGLHWAREAIDEARGKEPTA